jgi:hypothetical protein
MDCALTPDEIVTLFPKYFTISMIGVRNSGKSVLIQQIIKALQAAHKVDVVLVMSGSARLNDDYNFLPSSMVMNFDDALLQRIWAKQVADKKDKKEKHVFIVFDDCLATPEAIRNNIMQKIWVQGRHVSISSAILSQYPAYVLTPTILGNSDLLFYSKLNRQALEKLWTATTGLALKEFIKLSESTAGVNYTYLVINNYCKNPDWREYMTCVRALLEDKKPAAAAPDNTDKNNIADPNINV